MKPTALLTVAALVACSPAQQAVIDKGLESNPGRLFCSIQTAGGGSFVASLTALSIGAAVPGSGPLVVIATDAGKAAVDADCAKAAKAIAGGVSGVPVAPPPNVASVPSVAIVAPASPVVVK